MDDLVQFIRARLDEEEAACRSTRKDGGGCWNLLAYERGDGAIYDDTGNPVLTYDVDPKTGIATRYDENPLGARQAAFIVRHDPDRVLAEVEAKREMLRQYDNLAYNVMSDDQTGVWALEAVIRAFAVAHADHPDYNQAWRP
jgi:hypothetical protein